MLVAPSRSGFIAPCIPTGVFEPRAGPDWVHEIKHDGYRLQVRRDGDAVRRVLICPRPRANASGFRTASAIARDRRCPCYSAATEGAGRSYRSSDAKKRTLKSAKSCFASAGDNARFTCSGRTNFAKSGSSA
jgi:hypothetical protein